MASIGLSAIVAVQVPSPRAWTTAWLRLSVSFLPVAGLVSESFE